MARHDLSVELAELTGLPFETCSVLVDGTASGLPVELSWTQRGPIGATTATVMIDQLFAPPRPDVPSTPGIAYLRKWGGGHPVYLSDVIEATAPETTYH